MSAGTQEDEALSRTVHVDLLTLSTLLHAAGYQHAAAGLWAERFPDEPLHTSYLARLDTAMDAGRSAMAAAPPVVAA